MHGTTEPDGRAVGSTSPTNARSEARDTSSELRPAAVPRLLVIDHTRIGNATATGEVKAAILATWPPDLLLQVYDGGSGAVRVAGGPSAIDSGDDVAGTVAAFDPDAILYRPVPRTDALHRFAMELIARTNVPLAVWVVDDWPTAYAQDDPIRAARLEEDFRSLLARAGARFSISSAMSAAFRERYGVPFVPLANGVDPRDWPAAQRRPTTSVTVRYAGSLAENMTRASVRLVAGVIEQLAESGLGISLEIRSQRHWLRPNAEWLDELEHTHASTSDLSAEDYRRWLRDADILLIAYNFDRRSRDYIRYSLANKLPECLASGTPVLAVGPDDAETIATLSALDVGERVTTAEPSAVAEALRLLATSPERRHALAVRAQEVAFSRFDIRQTRLAFEAAMRTMVLDHRAPDRGREQHAHVEETAVVADLLAGRRGPDHVMLDVGAHTGSSAVRFDRLGWTVHCFEPHPGVRATLAERFAGHTNVVIDPRALSDAPAQGVPLFDSSQSSGITTLRPFHPSHREAAHVDVTTVAEVVRELGLTRVDFLKIDVEGLDLAVLRGVPWDVMRPDVIECEFEDAKTLAQGHSWRDMAVFLRDRGYAVYVSEWHPVIQYGQRHDWRRVLPFDDRTEVDPDAWGNFVAFRADPRWPVVRRAFERQTELGLPQPRKAPSSIARRLLRRGRRAAAAILKRR